MRRTTTVVLAMLLAMGGLAAPAAADDGPTSDLTPCTAADTAGATVVKLSGGTTTMATPRQPLYQEATRKLFVLDLAGQRFSKNRAKVGIRMTWTVPAEDYDLNMLDFRGQPMSHSEKVQPFDGLDEYVTGEVLHCQKFSAEALAWTAVGVSELRLTLTAELL